MKKKLFKKSYTLSHIKFLNNFYSDMKLLKSGDKLEGT